MMVKNIKIRKLLAMAMLSVSMIVNFGIPAFAADTNAAETNIAIQGTATASYCSPWESIDALNDGYTPKNSNDRSHAVYGNWDNPGTTQWVQYDWSSTATINKIDIYWFDDDQGIDLPASYAIKYWNGNSWTAVANPAGLGTAANQYNSTTFQAVTTTRLRVEITARPGYSTGILELRVYGTIADDTSNPSITAPPSWVDSFYTKSLTSYGIPICATDNCGDTAIYQAYKVVDVMLRKIAVDKPEILQRMRANKVKVVIIALNEYNYQHPDWAGWSDHTERRAGGGFTTTTLEEENDVPPGNFYLQNFNVLSHEFAHTILMAGIGDAAHPGADPELFNQILNAYNNAMAKNLYTESSYDRTNYHEYWAGQVPRWFNANPTNLNVPNAANLSDREQLRLYDPDIYNIIATLFGDYKLPPPFNN